MFRLVILLGAFTLVYCQENLIQTEIDGCSSSEETSEEMQKVFDECAEEVEGAIMAGLDGTMHKGLSTLRQKRDADMSPAEKRMTGCIIQCVLSKYNILEEDGLPSRAGLLMALTDGVTDQHFYTAASRAVDRCYQTYRDFRHHVRRNGPSTGGLYCDMAFDAFTCYADEIQNFCDSKMW